MKKNHVEPIKCGICGRRIWTNKPLICNHSRVSLINTETGERFTGEIRHATATKRL